jgi:hypothetical protein
MDENQIVSRWYPWRNVSVTTWLIAGLPWHLRIHYIETERPLTLAEGGFAVARESRSTAAPAHTMTDRHHLTVYHEDGTGASAIHDLMEEAEANCIQPEANTNLCNPRTWIPTLKKDVGAGKHWLITAVYGSKSAGMPDNLPSLLERRRDVVCIRFGNKKIMINKGTKQVEVVEH